MTDPAARATGSQRGVDPWTVVRHRDDVSAVRAHRVYRIRSAAQIIVISDVH